MATWMRPSLPFSTSVNQFTVNILINMCDIGHMVYSLGQAAKAAGKSKTAIAQAIQKGKISAEKNVHGRWCIEPSELHRVYPAVHQVDNTPAQDSTVGSNTLQDGSVHEIALLKEQLASSRKQVEYLEGQVDDLRSDRDAWREQAQRKLLTWRGLFGGGKAE